MRAGILVAVGVVGLVVGGCGGESTAPLTLRLRTDYLPGVEFVSVETRLVDRGMFATDSALLPDDFRAGQEIARFDGVPDGEHEVTVSLTGPRGEHIGGRRVRVAQRGATEVTVVLTRSCDAVRCGESESCLAGSCVDVECITGAEPGCPGDECAADADCGTPVATCATVGCVDGVCLTSVASNCGDGLYCAPETGCTPIPDAGGECGNGAVDLGEDCDDGNATEDDGCSSTCALEDQGPGGQSCGDAVPLRLVPTGGGRLGAEATGDSTGALESAIGSCESGGDREDVIYELQLETDATVTLALAPLVGGIDSYVHVRGLGGAPCVDPAGEAACADTGGCGTTEVLTTPLASGRYYIVVDSIDSGGPYRLTLSVVPAP